MTSTTHDEKTLILKTDALGRVHMPKDRREAIVDAFESSGLSGQVFAAQAGLKYSTFAGWVQKRRQARGDYKKKKAAKTQSPAITLFEAVVDSKEVTPSPGALKVEATAGLKFCIRTSEDVALAVELLQGLKGAHPC